MDNFVYICFKESHNGELRIESYNFVYICFIESVCALAALKGGTHRVTDP